MKMTKGYVALLVIIHRRCQYEMSLLVLSVCHINKARYERITHLLQTSGQRFGRIASVTVSVTAQ